MAIYLLNFISIPIYALLIKKKRPIIFLLSLQMFLILALRADTLGVDLENYKIFFNAYREMSFGEIIRGFRPIGGSAHDYGVESGYVLLNWVVAKLGFEFHGFLVVYAAILVTSVAIFIDRYCEDAALGFATFIALGGFITSFGILRQSLGLAVFLFAIPALVERKFWKYCLIVFVAGLFHQSLLIAVLLYFIAKFKANKALYVTVILASIALVVLTPALYNGIIFPILVKLDRYYYISGFEWNNMFALMLLIAVLLMFFFKHERSGKKEDNSMQCGYLFAIPLQALAFYMPIFSRLAGAVFINFLSPIFSSLVTSLKTESQRIQARSIIYVGLFAFHLYTLMIDDVLVPYLPFWAV